MAIKVSGTEVISDSRNINNVVSANVVSLSIGGTEVTASAAELNAMVGINTGTTVQAQIDGFDFADQTLIKTFVINETADITLSSNTFISPTIGVVKNVSGTLTGAILGTDYVYTFTNSNTVVFRSLINADFRIRVL